LAFSGHTPLQADKALGTGQAIRCTDAIDTGVGADWPTHILHTGLGWGKGGDKTAYVMPD